MCVPSFALPEYNSQRKNKHLGITTSYNYFLMMH